MPSTFCWPITVKYIQREWGRLFVRGAQSHIDKHSKSPRWHRLAWQLSVSYHTYFSTTLFYLTRCILANACIWIGNKICYSSKPSLLFFRFLCLWSFKPGNFETFHEDHFGGILVIIFEFEESMNIDSSPKFSEVRYDLDCICCGLIADQPIGSEILCSIPWICPV